MLHMGYSEDSKIATILVRSSALLPSLPSPNAHLSGDGGVESELCELGWGEFPFNQRAQVRLHIFPSSM